MSDQDIQDVANKAELTRPQLLNLYTALKVTESDIENQERIADTRDFKIQAQFVLRHWRQINGESATRKVLLEALQECGYIQAKQILEKKWEVTEEGRYAGPSYCLFAVNKVGID